MTKSILVVEDDDLNAKLLRVVLEESGFAVLLEQMGSTVIERASSSDLSLASRANRLKSGCEPALISAATR